MERIKLLRNNQGISQQKLADIIGVSRSTIAMWELGKSEPDSLNLSRLAEHFGVSVDYILGRNETPEETKEPVTNSDELINNNPELTEYLEMLATRPECRMLFSISKDATKEDVERAVAIIEALRKKDSESDVDA